MKINNASRIYYLLVMLSLPVTGQGAVNWYDNSISLLYGDEYEVGDNEKTVVTFEHRSDHDWGDLFIFVDRYHHLNDDKHEVYGEVSPNLSITKLAQPEHSKNSLIKEIYLAGTWEHSSGQVGFDNFLLGAGIKFNLPGFKFFKLTYYRRHNKLYRDNNQISVAWALPFKIGAQAFLYDGFIDAVDSTTTTTAGFNFTSQLKWDIGRQLDIEKDKLFIGIEYVYWINKFGIQGVDEKNPNLIIKWHF